MTKVFTNKKQFEKLVHLMESNPDIAQSICGKAVAKNRWETFADELNSLGPPMRTWDKWLKVWTDLKFKTKKKKSETQATSGGGPNKLHTLSSLEESVINLLSINPTIETKKKKSETQTISGGSSIKLQNFSNLEVRALKLLDLVPNDGLSVTEIEKTSETPNEYTENTNSNILQVDEEPGSSSILEECTEEEPLTLRSTTKSHQKNSKDSEQRMKLLKKQFKMQEDFQNDMKCTLKDIKTSISSMEEYTKKIYDLKKSSHREILDIKREKLQLYKDEIKNQHRYRCVKLKLQRQKLLLQKTQLDLQLRRLI